MSTWKKSHARVPAACDRMNSDHEGPDLRGAGPARRRRSTLRTRVTAAQAVDPALAPFSQLAVGPGAVKSCFGSAERHDRTRPLAAAAR